MYKTIKRQPHLVDPFFKGARRQMGGAGPRPIVRSASNTSYYRFWNYTLPIIVLGIIASYIYYQWKKRAYEEELRAKQLKLMQLRAARMRRAASYPNRTPYPHTNVYGTPSNGNGNGMISSSTPSPFGLTGGNSGYSDFNSPLTWETGMNTTKPYNGVGNVGMNYQQNNYRSIGIDPHAVQRMY